MDHKKIELSSKEKLFRSAAALFATKGFKEVSVREIANHSKVNSALVGYYFGGKRSLFHEVYRAYTVPLAKERMERLRAITENGRKPTIEEILEAWLLPWLITETDHPDNPLNLQFSANISFERWRHEKKAAPYMTPTFAAFMKALQKCLPSLSKETLMWRLHFVTGAIAHGLIGPNTLIAFSAGKCDPTNAEAAMAQMIPYAAAGFCAPEPTKPLTRSRAPRSTGKRRK
jgi:AcrR family transcriptional regulator